MVENSKKTTLGWVVPYTVKESFTKFCVEQGDVAQDACAGAVLLWQYLPANIRKRFTLAAKGLSEVSGDILGDLRKDVISEKITAIAERTKVMEKSIASLQTVIGTVAGPTEPSEEAETESPSTRAGRQIVDGAVADGALKKPSRNRRGSSRAG